MGLPCVTLGGLDLCVTKQTERHVKKKVAYKVYF